MFHCFNVNSKFSVENALQPIRRWIPLHWTSLSSSFHHSAYQCSYKLTFEALENVEGGLWGLALQKVGLDECSVTLPPTSHQYFPSAPRINERGCVIYCDSLRHFNASGRWHTIISVNCWLTYSVKGREKGKILVEINFPKNLNKIQTSKQTW